MPNYEVEFEYKVLEYGATALQADNPDQADEYAREYIYETFPDITDLSIITIKEIK